jgi:hypothetical protein
MDEFDTFVLPDPEPEGVPRLPSTAQTRERFAFLKTKRMGAVWQEGDCIYRKGPCGITVFDFGD